MSQNQEAQQATPFSHIPTPGTLHGNPYLPPQDGRCLINELPTELLSQIFLMGADMDPADEDEEEDFDSVGDDEDDEDEANEADKDEEEDEDEEKPPLEVTASHVCKLWRDVTIDTPALWSTLTFAEGPPYTKSAIYLERSKGAPLDLSIDVTKDDDDEETDLNNPVPALAELMVCSDELEAILQLIIPHVWHWRSLELMVSEYILMQSALDQMGACTSAPMLEVLHLYHYEDSEEGEETFVPAKFKAQDFVLFHGNAPKLTHVALWGVHLDWAASTFLSGLVELELAYHAKDVRPPFKDFARILGDSPEIKTLTLCQSGPAGGPVEWLDSVLDPDAMQTSETNEPEANTTLSLPSLQNLVIAFLDPEYLKQLIARLALPNLTSLAIDIEDADGRALLQTLTRAAPATGKSILSGLKALKVAGVQCDEDSVVADAYAALTNLLSLNLNFDFVPTRWYDVLVAQWDSATSLGKDPFLPRLESLMTTGLSGKDVRKLIEARKAMGKPIKQVFMNQDDDLEEEDEQWIKDNVDEFEYFEGSDDEEDLEIVIDEDEDQWEDERNRAAKADTTAVPYGSTNWSWTMTYYPNVAMESKQTSLSTKLYST
ncbi:uncharacterized protein B0H18DRAFT_319726 [Fomitopsis serialis]|uniref:uncharacterized protein n=1 Tax=Fomitopsis serialis TaxID=139415 RepID=UPI0020076BAA|nr:uncharacterized protein B0H18DRAFT_319726 [Neoantrodia serialis]KAH9936311.1 hypothetical protein B0H18DRAFT_319726 [Neoantrodia serialis]